MLFLLGLLDIIREQGRVFKLRYYIEHLYDTDGYVLAI